MKTFKSWDQFLQAEIPFSLLLQNAKLSNLGLVDPGEKRPNVWAMLVNPEFAQTSIAQFNLVLLEKTISIPESVAKSLSQDVELVSDDLEIRKKITNLLSIFLSNHSHLEYHSGLLHIANLIVNVFKSHPDAYAVFSHTITHIFSQDLLVRPNLMIELKSFVLMAEQYLPGLSTALSVHENLYAFVMTVQNIAKEWVMSLFTSVLDFDSVVRVWDNILLYEFEFVCKFALELLKTEEENMVRKIQEEGIEDLYDLICCGNSIRNSHTFRPNIEKMIIKACTMPCYPLREHAMNRIVNEDIYSQVRMDILKKTQDIVQEVLYFESAEKIIKMCGSHTSRIMFTDIAKDIGWTDNQALCAFVTIDQTGTENLPSELLKIGLILLLKDVPEEKLRILFQMIKVKNAVSVCKLLIAIENFLEEGSQSNFDFSDFTEDCSINEDKFVSFVIENTSFMQKFSQLSPEVKDDPIQIEFVDDLDLQLQELSPLDLLNSTKKERISCTRLCSDGSCALF